MTVRDAMLRAFLREGPPAASEYLPLIEAATAALRSEAPDRRPTTIRGRPGGLIMLEKDLPTIVVPDLHARRGFFISLMESRLPGGGTVLEALGQGSLQLLCLGDGFHAEARAIERWKAAYAEYAGNYRERAAMDQEMAESMGLMEMAMLAKINFPRHFHFLKGNHENVLNEEGQGNHPFRKFVQEGDMVYAYLDAFYGRDFIQAYAGFEKSLPLFAVGARFLASHAEPARAYALEELVNAPHFPEVVLGLTWTDNGAAEPGSVQALLSRLLPGQEKPRFLTGHRTIPGLYRERSGGYHLQIHNPSRYVVAWAMPERDLEPEFDIGEIRDLGPSLAKANI